MVNAYIKSSLPEIDVPDIDIPSFFFASVKRHAVFTRRESPRPLFIEGTESVTLVQLESLCTRLASGLYHTAGVRSGSVVAVVLGNTIHYPMIILSALMAGASCTLVNPAYTAREIGHQLSDSRATHVVTTTALCSVVEAAIGKHKLPIHQILVTDDAVSQTGTLNVQSVFGMLSSQEFPRASVDSASTVAFVPYSSGTTGTAKGVLLSHRNIVANVLQVAALSKCSEPSTSAGVLPMFHSFGLLFLCLLMPYKGTTTVVMARFDMQGFLQMVQDHHVTEAMLVPPIITGLIKSPQLVQQYDLSSLKTIVAGAAPLSSSAVAEIERLLPNVRVAQGYGMSEASPALSINPSEGAINPRSAGCLLPNIEAKVIDDNGRVVGLSETGELCFRGPNIMLGYLGNASATHETVDSEGFLRTGDIGHIDKSKHVYITDRKKELIKFNGFQVAPAELEGLLMQHPQIKDCAVAAVFDERRQTQVPRAYFVVSECDNAQAVGQCVVEWLNAQVAYYKQLRGGFVILEAIPKSASGKILRRMLPA
ncbi:hypothetical protein IW137_001074 [Coemansia sp. RSA 1287]|nr:hypothetical protein GGH98_002003 [Coemansia sp. RSA 454]KAJ2552577.1 hypothetical protein IWW35_002263 [Coemansia sp. RSA 1878]KAJ2586281.1 hypothetical protein IWW49_004107 [Coemansia sp. RSA 1797]KAJ2649416.1 hypothetical protein IW137_001074 [Coemansia sp. RSA 1287]